MYYLIKYKPNGLIIGCSLFSNDDYTEFREFYNSLKDLPEYYNNIYGKQDNFEIVELYKEEYGIIEDKLGLDFGINDPRNVMDIKKRFYDEVS